MITASADAVLLGMKERKVWLLGDPDSLLEVVRRPSGSTPQLALSVSLRRHTQPLLRMPSKMEWRILSQKAEGRDFLAKQLRVTVTKCFQLRKDFFC